ncbi:MAG: peroxiredoxin family protein [Planctomycetota bacterium]|nr:peroxiredoxin family protein [Planctomycetota bacterium]
MKTIHLLAAVCASTLLLSTTPAQEVSEENTEQSTLWGHSSHGSVYDVGPRHRPWRMEGIGKTPFPITSEHPEVQEWFDQGIALLHGFWYYEAERSFRWCLKLDPECAMAYWAMALTVRSDPTQRNRSAEFLEKAVKRKDTVTERERGFIEVLEAMAEVKKLGKDERDKALAKAMVRLDRLAMDYPDDIEAKTLYWLLAGRALGDKREYARFGMEAVLDSVLREAPDHVGALHYRVHNWDGKEGSYAVDSCMKLPEIAPECGHLLHMPGHVLSGIGMWHEAAIAMDRATRVEKEYMHDRMILPEDNWDYVHNLHYLGYIQEQLGMANAAIYGARQLLAAPASPDSKMIGSFTKNAMVRALVKFERWEEILDPDHMYWNEGEAIEQALSVYPFMRAHIGLGQLDEAQGLLEEWRMKLDKQEPSGPPTGPPDFDAFVLAEVHKLLARQLDEVEALLLLARGQRIEGLGALATAAALQVEEWQDDPPLEPTFLYNRLGDEYLALGAPALAAECYERTLETVFHDGFALAGLVVAYDSLGEEEKARKAMAALGVVWSDADRPNRWLSAAEATGVVAEPFIDAPLDQRNYKREVLDVQGPSEWIPTSAPNLTALDSEGKEVKLADYEGQNVLLIFYLGEECVHCIEQINLAEANLDEIEALNTVVLGVSKDTVKEIATQQESLGVRLLSDPEFTSAHRFQSYDDFEEIELHSTFLINRKGQVHWSRIGGEPFTNFEFLVAELEALERRESARSASVPSQVVREPGADVASR